MRSFSVISGEVAAAQQFINLRADARGGSVLLAQQMLGSFNLSTNPANAKTLTLDINGTNVVFTFVTSIGSTPGNVLIGASATATVANLLALLTQPQTTTSTGVALSGANQTLVSYLSCFAPAGGTTLYVTSNNTSLYAPLTSFSASTNATSDSWTANTMALYVHKGTVYVNGTRVLFGGGISPTVTAPVSHPRIDVLTVDSTGALAWTTGTENASPVAPTYPNNKVALCELYNVVGETALYDFDNQQVSQGYVYNDVRPTLGTGLNTAAIPDSLIPSADGTYDLGSGTFEWNNIYAKTGIFLNGQSINSSLSFALTATESISAGAPVASTLYQSTPVGYDTSGAFASTGSPSGTVVVGSNSNRALAVMIFGSDPTATMAITYNGTSITLTKADFSFGGDGSYAVWYGILVAPSTGSHSLATTVTSGSGTYDVMYWSLYNVVQTSPLDAVGSAGGGLNGTAVTATATLGTDGAYFFGGFGNGGTGAGVGTITGNAYAANTGTGSGYAHGTQSSSVFGAGTPATIATTGASTAQWVACVMSVKPLNAAAAAVQNASSASVASGNTRCTGFIGFALSSVTVGQTLTVVTQGVVTGLSSIQSGIEYYLNDTNGTIGSSAGTNTRKVGVGLNATQLLITNIW